MSTTLTSTSAVMPPAAAMMPNTSPRTTVSTGRVVRSRTMETTRSI